MFIRISIHGFVTEYFESGKFKELLHSDILEKPFYNKNMKYLLSFCDSFDKAKNLCKNEKSIPKTEMLEKERYRLCI